jgi:hypothetical protein
VGGEGSREPPTDLGALVGVLTEERDDEERQTRTPSASGGDGGDTLDNAPTPRSNGVETSA